MWNENERLTNTAPSEILIELVQAIKRGDKQDAFSMLERYVPNGAHREIVERYKR